MDIERKNFLPEVEEEIKKQLIQDIVKRKKLGIDCTEAESAEIKMFIKENTQLYDKVHLFGVPNNNALTEEILNHFSIEYDEALNEL